MKLEPIDTSTTEGKIEVMRLASEGRRVATKPVDPQLAPFGPEKWMETSSPVWGWSEDRYAIIAEPVGPEEVWMVIDRGGYGRYIVCEDKQVADKYYSDMYPIVRYVRADD